MLHAESALLGADVSKVMSLLLMLFFEVADPCILLRHSGIGGKAAQAPAETACLPAQCAKFSSKQQT